MAEGPWTSSLLPKESHKPTTMVVEVEALAKHNHTPPPRPPRKTDDCHRSSTKRRTRTTATPPSTNSTMASVIHRSELHQQQLSIPSITTAAAYQPRLTGHVEQSMNAISLAAPNVKVVVRIIPPPYDCHTKKESSDTLAPTDPSSHAKMAKNNATTSSKPLTSFLVIPSIPAAGEDTTTNLQKNERVLRHLLDEDDDDDLEDDALSLGKSSQCSSSVVSGRSAFSWLRRRRAGGKATTTTNNSVAAVTSTQSSKSRPSFRPFSRRQVNTPSGNCTTATILDGTDKNAATSLSVGNCGTEDANSTTTLTYPKQLCESNFPSLTAIRSSEWDAVYGPTVSSRAFYTHVTAGSFSNGDRHNGNTTLLLYGTHDKSRCLLDPQSHSLTKRSEGILLEAVRQFFAAAESSSNDGTMKATVLIQISAVQVLSNTNKLRDLLQPVDLCSTTATVRDKNGENRNASAAKDLEEDANSLRSWHSIAASAQVGSDNTSNSPSRHPRRRCGNNLVRLVTIDSKDQARSILETVFQRRRFFSERDQPGGCSSSHAIYTLTSTTTMQPTSKRMNNKESGGASAVQKNMSSTATRFEKSCSTLTIVDLADADQTEDLGKENTTTRIHESSMTTQQQQNDFVVLAQVLTALLHRKSFVPYYHDATLTRLLRDALSGEFIPCAAMTIELQNPLMSNVRVVIHGTITGDCRIVLIACVSTDSCRGKETQASLCYAQHIRSIPPVVAVLATPPKKKKTALLDPHGMLTTPSQVTAALQAENKILQARIANLARRQRQEIDDSNGKLGLQPEQNNRGCEQTVLGDRSSLYNNSIATRSATNEPSVHRAEIESLEEKFLLAREQQQTARDRCVTVAAAQERLRLRCMNASTMTEELPTRQVCITSFLKQF